MKLRWYLLIFFVALLAYACRKPDVYPLEPVIIFKNIYTKINSQGYDEKMTVLLNFTDGDGDVGYKDPGQNGLPYDDPTSKYYDNYIAKLFQFKNGAWVEYPTISPLGGRIPYLTPIGKNKALNGEIACDIDVPPKSENDTFRLDIFIYDRTLQQSNTVTTSEVVLNTK